MYIWLPEESDGRLSLEQSRPPPAAWWAKRALPRQTQSWIRRDTCDGGRSPTCHPLDLQKKIYFSNMLDIFIQHCFICHPTDSNVSQDAGIEPRTDATSALAVGRSKHSATSHPQVC